LLTPLISCQRNHLDGGIQGRQKTEDGRGMTEDRSQAADDGREMIEDRRDERVSGYQGIS